MSLISFILVAIFCSKRFILFYFIGLVDRLFTNSPGHLGSILDRVIPKTLKMVLDTSFLNTHQYMVRIKDKVQQSRKRSSALLNTLL